MIEDSATELFDDFYSTIDRIYGLYLDTDMGFTLNVRQHEQNQHIVMNMLSMTQEELDAQDFLFGVGDPNEGGELQHRCSQGEFKYRNGDSGKNLIELGNLCVTQIYQYWEDHYRGEISKSLGIDKKELISDVFGDIRFLRIAITHHKGIAIEKINKYKVFKWFDTGDAIELSRNQVYVLMRSVKGEIIRLRQQFGA